MSNRSRLLSRKSVIVQVDCYLYSAVRRLSVKELAKKQNRSGCRTTHGPIGRTEVTKYSVSAKQLPGTPLCCSYDNATRCPAAFSIFSATASSRTLNVKICGEVPGKALIANSPPTFCITNPFSKSFGHSRRAGRWSRKNEV